MTLEDFEEYASENLEQNDSVGKATVKIDRSIIDEFKERVNVSTNKAVSPVVEAVLLDELDEEEASEKKMEEFQEEVA